MQAAESAKRIYLPYDLTLRDSSHRRIARHLGGLSHIHSDEKHLGSEPCGSYRGFTSGVSGTYDYYVILTFHSLTWQANQAMRFPGRSSPSGVRG